MAIAKTELQGAEGRLPKAEEMKDIINGFNQISATLEEKNGKPLLPACVKDFSLASSRNILSVFGGADITPAALPNASTVYILDMNPFLTRTSLTSLVTSSTSKQEQCGLFHPEVAEIMRTHSPFLYAGMYDGFDFNSPYGLFGLLIYRLDDDELARIFFSPMMQEIRKSADDPVSKLSDIGISTILLNRLDDDDDELARIFISPMMQEIRKSADDPVSKLSDIGISTILLNRIRLCCNAEILSIKEIINEGVYQIDIKKPDGREVAIFYVQCQLGMETTQHNPSYLWLLDDIRKNGIDTVMTRGFPSEFFQTKPDGDIAAIQHDFVSLIENAPIKQCVCCTVDRDSCAPIFDDKQVDNRFVICEEPKEVLYVGSKKMLRITSNKQKQNTVDDNNFQAMQQSIHSSIADAENTNHSLELQRQKEVFLQEQAKLSALLEKEQNKDLRSSVKDIQGTANLIQKTDPPVDYPKLTESLASVIRAHANPNKENINSLVNLGQEVQSKPSAGWKALGIAMMVFGAGLAALGGLMIAASLAPTLTGALTPLGAAGLTTGGGFIAGGAAIFSAGLGFFVHEKKEQSQSKGRAELGVCRENGEGITRVAKP
jgi:hypothetical protein